VITALPLGAGEREAISLAQDLRAGLLLMDDLAGREEAEHHGFAVMGTLRVLELAAERGLLDFPAAITKLQQYLRRLNGVNSMVHPPKGSHFGHYVINKNGIGRCRKQF